MTRDDNRLSMLDIIEQLGKMGLRLRSLNFAHEFKLSTGRSD
jgi:hypothetical protein